MARVKYQKARKDYPNAGIKKGDMYYYARIKTGPRSSREIRQLTRIKPSQLTSSEYLSQAYALQEQLAELSSLETLQADLEGIASEVRELAEETQGKYDNMPDGLQQGDTGVLLEERAAAMEAWADSIEEAASSAGDKYTEFEDNQKAWDEYDEALSQFDTTGEDGQLSPDQDPPEEPDEERMDEGDLVQEILGEIEEPDIQ